VSVEHWEFKAVTNATDMRRESRQRPGVGISIWNFDGLEESCNRFFSQLLSRQYDPQGETERSNIERLQSCNVGNRICLPALSLDLYGFVSAVTLPQRRNEKYPPTRTFNLIWLAARKPYHQIETKGKLR
jgi:hypothetical protein